MPLRGYSREQGFLLPPDPNELLPETHPARFIAMYVDELRTAAWLENAIPEEGERRGAPAYHPRMLLSVWLYGCFSHVVSVRKLETACRESLPFMWLSGYQRPDHNTLWRFFNAHRDRVRALFKATVRMAAELGLFDPTVQALDGTKLAGNASAQRSHNADQLKRLLERVDRVLEEIEQQNEQEGPAEPALPRELTSTRALRDRIRSALEQSEAQGGGYVNLTDGEAGLLKGRQGFVAGFNGQALVAPIPAEQLGQPGLFITAVGVSNDPEDHAQLVPMLEEAAESGVTADVLLADAGYHSGANLEACAERGQQVLMPESTPDRVLEDAFHKDRFSYDAASDTYRCPAGQTLNHQATKWGVGGRRIKVYRAGVVCRECPFFGTCTKDGKQGRSLRIGEHDTWLREHRVVMRTAGAKVLYGRRKVLVEPVFGILKEQHGWRRLRVRGIAKAGAAWAFAALGFNLRQLYRAWARRPAGKGWGVAPAGLPA